MIWVKTMGMAAGLVYIVLIIRQWKELEEGVRLFRAGIIGSFICSITIVPYKLITSPSLQERIIPFLIFMPVAFFISIIILNSGLRKKTSSS